MKLNNVLIIYKKLHKSCGDQSISSGAADFEHHTSTMHEITRVLDDFGITYEISTPYQTGRRDARFDMIITIGGDGTFLSAAHKLDGIPLLGVNSMPGHSIGFFCASTAIEFKNTIKSIIDESLIPNNLPAMRIRLDGEEFPFHPINDILFARSSPAEMARYSITIEKKSERQRSSGIWIATGAGSTAGILSAGGKRYPIESEFIQYLVREPYAMHASNYKLLNGIISNKKSIVIMPERDADIYIDGPTIVKHVLEGQSISISMSTDVKIPAFLRDEKLFVGDFQ